MAAYLFTGLSVQKNETNLNGFCRIFGHIDTVFVAGRGNVDDDVTVEVWLLRRLRCHSCYIVFTSKECPFKVP